MLLLQALIDTMLLKTQLPNYSNTYIALDSNDYANDRLVLNKYIVVSHGIEGGKSYC